MKLSEKQVQLILVAKAAFDVHNEAINEIATQLMCGLGPEVLGTTTSAAEVREFLEDFDATAS